jgi:glutathione synthase/RimK-type ligase-like ATP-grasp enzyme
MKKPLIAIHLTKGSFSEHWVDYCKKNNIDFKIVNCYSTSIISDIKDCDALMWHPLQHDYMAELFFKQLIYSVQLSDIKVFPDFYTVWHFDDKVGQKYLFESVNAPLVNTHVFYNKEEALQWVNTAEFPKVFKLRAGSGSKNVVLVRTRNDARNRIKKAFGSGFSQYNKWGSLKERIRKYRKGKTSINDVLKGFYRLLIPPTYSKILRQGKGYIYFQDFIPENSYDIRVIVIGNRAFAIKRMVRENDFRASGGGNIIYTKSEIDERCVRIAFDVNKSIRSQCIAYDFVFDQNRNPLIIEISYGFRPSGYFDCEGYWDDELNFYSGSFNPYGWMIEDLLNS